MSISEYAIALSNLARWTAGEINDSTAYYHWEQLIKAGHALEAVPDKQKWPTQLRRPKTNDVPDPDFWGSWEHLLAAVSPLGFFSLMLGDEGFRATLEGLLQKGANAASSAAKLASRGLSSLLPWVGLGVLGYLYIKDKK